jgi:hypothetical protein
MASLLHDSRFHPGAPMGSKFTEIHAKGIVRLLYEDFGDGSLMGRCEPSEQSAWLEPDEPDRQLVYPK